MMREGILMVISGPAGAGKGTLANMLIQRDQEFTFSVSVTTRSQRPMEIAGVHYHFISEEAFEHMDQNGDFLETATVHGYRYGTPLKPVMKLLGEGRDLLLDIDVQGAASVMARLANCVTVFILPPSFEELERRLRSRNTENEAELQKRMQNARKELQKLSNYSYAIINEDVETAYRQLESIVIAERHNTVRYHPQIL